ncbi:hypothetical protein INR49_014269 [Caranx melampygus]|nr:hypothetical protein INR49_014269 [Caranx melampygus]
MTAGEGKGLIKTSNCFLQTHQGRDPLSPQVTEEVTLDSNNQQQMSQRRKTLQEHRKWLGKEHLSKQCVQSEQRQQQQQQHRCQMLSRDL